MNTPWANRMKSNRPRHDRDFYATPHGLVDDVLSEFICNHYDFRHDFSLRDPYRIVDPGCGDGVWGKAARKLFPKSSIVGIDIEETQSDDVLCYDEYLVSDFLDVEFHPIIDLVIGNPPYKHAEAFIRKSMDILKDGGHIYFLLQLNFLGSRKRQLGLFAEYPIKSVNVLTRRPSFFSSGGGERHTTDANNYAMYLWEKGYSGSTQIDWTYWNYENNLASRDI